jgi:hypothetical protein
MKDLLASPASRFCYLEVGFLGKSALKKSTE